ncbi:hypothetical protein [Pimelobacter simplex]|uniref:hypothetical protein n=1 Tax=Nocardioides simplex TaxID=2045 RepID=UPI003AAB058C
MSTMPPRLRALAAASVAALALSALSACDEDGDDGGSPEPAASGTPTPPGSPTASSPAPSTSPAVLDRGAAPRRLLRIGVEKGHVEHATIALTTTQSSTLRGTERFAGEMRIPMTLQVTSTVTDVSDDELSVETVFGRTAVDRTGIARSLAGPIEQALTFLEGATLTVVVRPDGTTVSRDVDLGDDDGPDLVGPVLDDVLAQGFAIARFPVEEVGLGARWRTTDEVEIGGASVRVGSTYEVVGLSDDGYTLDVRTEQTTAPGGPYAGGTIVEGSSTSRGRIEVRGGMFLPVRSSSTIRGTTVVDVGDARVTTRLTTEVRIATETR